MAMAIKRIYEDVDPDDGYRVLVDRLWPRGVSKQDAKLDEWFKEAAPSDELRQWFHSEEGEWAEFRQRYLSELSHHRDNLRTLADRAKQQQVTLLYSAKNTQHNNAVVLKEYINKLG